MSAKIFRDYAAFYNLLYQDKDSAGEAKYIESLLKRARPTADKLKIIDVGCGTGRHAEALAKHGHQILGVDTSEEMIQLARSSGAGNVKYLVADAREFHIGEFFDAAVSLFHVASYQTSATDLIAFFRSISQHLRSQGLLIFDCWYGPAVLHQKPTVRVLDLEDDTLRVLRIARPLLVHEDNCVIVSYDLLVEKKEDGGLQRLREEHRMRYLFVPEIQDLLEGAGLRLLFKEEWLTGKPLGLDTWSACFVAVKQ
jgi:SAM-dependent methyltransferase